jgi:hypothetical protein
MDFNKTLHLVEESGMPKYSPNKIGQSLDAKGQRAAIDRYLFDNEQRGWFWIKGKWVKKEK